MSSVPTRALVLSGIGQNGRVSAGPLFAMASLLGHSDKAMRDCLGRVVREGLLTQSGGRGRSAEYWVTDAGRAALDVDLGWSAYAHRVDAGLEPWDRSWRLVGFGIPERRRGARDAIRNLLVEFGAAPVQSGLYVHAYDLTGFVFQLADHLEVSDAVTTFDTRTIRVGEELSDEHLVERLWPLADLAGRYEVVGRQLASIAEQAPTMDGDQVAASMVSAIVATEAVMRDDPLLPTELLPDRWPGTEARRAFLAAHSVASTHSELFRNSQLMQSYAQEIDRALAETSGSFWNRWWPRLTNAYQARLPPAATRS